MRMKEIINEGAEAQIIQIDSNILKKVRLPKSYRISQIDDKLRKSRNKREFKVLSKLYESNVNVAKPIELSDNLNDVYFTFEFIDGKNLKFVLNKDLLDKAFDEIIKLHNLDIVHGDLTTLNMIVKDNLVYLIDFGLSEFSHKVEDKAVDLNLFFNCIKNEHIEVIGDKKELLKKYEIEVDRGKEIVKRLENIEKRGRNK